MPPGQYQSDGKCPKCGCRHYWPIRRGRRKCAAPKCEREYSDSWGKTFLPRDTWLKVAYSFTKRFKLKKALQETGLTKRPYLCAVKDIRTAIHKRLVSKSNKRLLELSTVGHSNFSNLREDCSRSSDYFLRVCIAKRKGIGPKNFHLHLAEAIWWRQHIGGGQDREKAYRRKASQIKDLMEEMRNPDIEYSNFCPKIPKRLPYVPPTEKEKNWRW